MEWLPVDMAIRPNGKEGVMCKDASRLSVDLKKRYQSRAQNVTVKVHDPMT